MDSTKQHKNWLLKCQFVFINAERRRKKIHRLAGLATFLSENAKQLNEKRIYSQKRYHRHPLYKLRRDIGFYEKIFPIIIRYDDTCHSYFRMSAAKFEELLCIVGPSISKQYIVQEPIPAAARLALTLRYLATGDCITSTTFTYLIGLTTAINIIHETCRALLDCLSTDILPYPLTSNDWLQIANEFEEKWNFPHCIGAIDGRHIAIECPNNAGSSYFNYKLYHSLVLMALFLLILVLMVDVVMGVFARNH